MSEKDEKAFEICKNKLPLGQAMLLVTAIGRNHQFHLYALKLLVV